MTKEQRAATVQAFRALAEWASKEAAHVAQSQTGTEWSKGEACGLRRAASEAEYRARKLEEG